MVVTLLDYIEDEKIGFVVIAAKYKKQWVLCFVKESLCYTLSLP